jgi:hypothetical protein
MSTIAMVVKTTNLCMLLVFFQENRSCARLARPLGGEGETAMSDTLDKEYSQGSIVSGRMCPNRRLLHAFVVATHRTLNVKQNHAEFDR